MNHEVSDLDPLTALCSDTPDCHVSGVQPVEPLLDSVSTFPQELPTTNAKVHIYLSFDRTIDDQRMFRNVIDVSTSTHTEIQSFVHYIRNHLTYYATNVTLKKHHMNMFGCMGLSESKLPLYNPFLSLRGFKYGSTYLHIYWNQMDQDMDYVGFLDSEMTHETMFNEDFFDPENRTMYVQWTDEPMVLNHRWSTHTTKDGTLMNSLLEAYNAHFHTHHTLFDLEGTFLSTRFCGIYPTATFLQLGCFLSKLLDELYHKHPQTYWGINAVHLDRAISLFHALQCIEGHAVANLPISQSDFGVQEGNEADGEALSKDEPTK